MSGWGAPLPELTGLSEAQAAERLHQHGPNELPQAARRTGWRIAAELLREPMLQLLAAAGGIYLVLGDVGEACMLLAFVVLSMLISLVQESRTERVLEALRDLSSPRALVLRGGERKRIAGREVVPGDLIVLEEGDRVPADARLLSANDLLTDESLLTGESVPVSKVVWAQGQAAARPGGDGQAWVYAGSMVVRGQGLAEVTATGARSEMGHIGVALRQIESSQPALQQQTRALVKTFAVAGVTLSLLMTLIYVWTRGDVLAAVLAGISLAMSLLPQEFLLILTVFMAMGAWRISQQRVLVRRASAIEALGTATVLCTDKTGTLTLNRMSIVAMQVPGQTWLAQDEDGGPLSPALRTLLQHGILASERDPFDPMEKAFWALGAQCLSAEEVAHLEWKMVHEYGLSPEMLAMSHVWRAPGQDGHVIATKGAPEAIVDLCHLDAVRLAEVRQAADVFARQGMRVLGVARSTHRGPNAHSSWPALQHDFDFEYLGLVALADPLRPTVRDAVQVCREAGIHVAMITGDHPVTALAIAAQAGLDVQGGVVQGEDLAALSDEALRERVAQAAVFARVMPEQKLRIVKALQASGQVVAMTGDGVNDAPSLKAADIGIAMGARGTDVAREAAAMVLLDDDFGTITQAVRSGRRIDDNLRKAMAFVLAVHVPIAGLTLLPLLMGWPLLLTPVHIAFLELIIDPVCSIVFEAEPEERDIMRRPPREPGRPLLTRAMMGWSLLQGLLVLMIVAAAYAWLLHQGLDEASARVGGFLSLVAANVVLIMGNRAFGGQILLAFFRPNPVLWRTLAATVALLALVLAVPVLRGLFKFKLPDVDTAQIVGLVALGTMLVLQALKAIRSPSDTSKRESCA
ncbi:MAG: cation-translocating P-type ATPase [Aquabacterium sp.]|uniref:cation-translocating P-type ATPase n=1 Tax=Aquabacterium sp. TaxID=1872578 RepID=UPI0025B99708|nr:cation-translocating P-type ATPase [Aquabacterium sp.]MBI3382441.1 cation-translocating P-type ATPase [Aquabacterium sp.]